MSGTIYGYMRVSSRDQNEERQRLAMREYGVPEKNLYLDKLSGKDFQRPAYRRLLHRMKRSGTLYSRLPQSACSACWALRDKNFKKIKV